MKYFNNKTILIIIIIITIIVINYIYNKNNEEEIQKVEYDNDTSQNVIDNNINEEEIKEKIKIHVAGAVNNEGLYEIEEEKRIADAIEMAGGLNSDADISNINLASKLEDGTKIYIPSISEKEVNEQNINTASQNELDTLPGIGPSTALKIIEYRKENGKFKSIEEIKEVQGIGESKYEKIKSLITI